MLTKIASAIPNRSHIFIRNGNILRKYQPYQLFAPILLFQHQISWLSSRNKRKKLKNNLNEPLMNKKLTNKLLNQNHETVRLVLDKGLGEPPEVNVVPLNDAINQADEFNLDLIGINLNHSPPVIKAVDYKKLLYDEKKKAKEVPSDPTAEGIKKKPKEFSFKTGIDINDLGRKLSNIVDFLTKGYQCNVQVQLKRRHKRSEDGGKNEISRIITTVNEYCGDYLSNKITPVNKEGSHTTSIRLQPKRNKK